MNYIGELRVTEWKIWTWCANTYSQELLYVGSRLLCFENKGYVRAYCLDDQRVYNLSEDGFTSHRLYSEQ